MARLDQVTPFLVMDIVRRARALPNVVHFEVGQPDLPPPPGVPDALAEAVRAGRMEYTESLGLPALREKIAEHYFHEYRVEVSPERVVLTVGTSGAFLIAYALLLNAGEGVLLPDPSYPCYKNFAHVLDLRPEFIPVDSGSHYQVTPEHLREASPTARALQISSPANPLGNVYSPDNLRALVEYCEERGIAFISDEIYHGLVYDGQANTALSFSDNAIVINGFSKYFCLPGLRLGWLILPPNKIRQAEILMQNLYISAPTLSQYGALAAFDYSYLRKVTETYRQRRDYLYQALSRLFHLDVRPRGAFYIWADISAYSDNSLDFAKRLLEEARVAATAGVDFGQYRTRHYLRFAYTRELDELGEGVTRLRNWLTA